MLDPWEVVLRDALADFPTHVFLYLAQLVDDMRLRARRTTQHSTLGFGRRTRAAPIAPNAALRQCRVTDSGNAAEVLPALHFHHDGVADGQRSRAVPSKKLSSIALEPDLDEFLALNFQRNAPFPCISRPVA